MSMLRLCVFDSKFLVMGDQEMLEIVDRTFLEVDGNSDGYISFDEYMTMASQHPLISSTLTVDHSILERLDVFNPIPTAS